MWDGSVWSNLGSGTNAGISDASAFMNTLVVAGTFTTAGNKASHNLAQWTKSCCYGRVGDANGSGADEPTIGDISILIDYLFITGSSLGLPECL
jgi:hypothetical protein